MADLVDPHDVGSGVCDSRRDMAPSKARSSAGTARARNLHELSLLPNDLQTRWDCSRCRHRSPQVVSPGALDELDGARKPTSVCQRCTACGVGSRTVEALFVLVFNHRVYFTEFVLCFPHCFGPEPYQSSGADSCMGRKADRTAVLFGLLDAFAGIGAYRTHLCWFPLASRGADSDGS